MDTKTLPALWQLICVWIIQVYGFSPERSRRNVDEFDTSQLLGEWYDVGRTTYIWGPDTWTSQQWNFVQGEDGTVVALFNGMCKACSRCLDTTVLRVRKRPDAGGVFILEGNGDQLSLHVESNLKSEIVVSLCFMGGVLYAADCPRSKLQVSVLSRQPRMMDVMLWLDIIHHLPVGIEEIDSSSGEGCPRLYIDPKLVTVDLVVDADTRLVSVVGFDSQQSAVVLPCSAGNQAAGVGEDSTVIWSRERTGTVLTLNDTVVGDTDHHKLRRYTQGVFDLLLQGVSAQDSDVYACYLETGERQITLSRVAVSSGDFAASPTIVYHSDNVTAHKGETVVLECYVNGNPPPSVTWWMRTPGETEAYVQKGGDGFRMQIDNVQADDEGVYKCEASSGLASPVFALVNLHVGFAPETEVKDSSILVPFGGEVVLTCHVLSKSSDTMTWQRNGADIKLDYRHSISLIQTSVYRYTMSLVVHQMTKEDFGQYACFAKNELGASSSSIEVTELPSTGDHCRVSNIPVMSNFNIQQYLGDMERMQTTRFFWGNQTYESEVQGFFITVSGSLVQYYRRFSLEKKQCLKPGAETMVRLDTPGDYLVSFGGRRGRYKIVYTDYTHSVVYFCMSGDDQAACPQHLVHVQILSRLPRIPDDVLQVLYGQVQLTCVPVTSLVDSVPGICKMPATFMHRKGWVSHYPEPNCQVVNLQVPQEVTARQVTGQWHLVGEVRPHGYTALPRNTLHIVSSSDRLVLFYRGVGSSLCSATEADILHKSKTTGNYYFEYNGLTVDSKFLHMDGNSLVLYTCLGLHHDGTCYGDSHLVELFHRTLDIDDHSMLWLIRAVASACVDVKTLKRLSPVDTCPVPEGVLKAADAGLINSDHTHIGCHQKLISIAEGFKESKFAGRWLVIYRNVDSFTTVNQSISDLSRSYHVVRRPNGRLLLLLRHFESEWGLCPPTEVLEMRQNSGPGDYVHTLHSRKVLFKVLSLSENTAVVYWCHSSSSDGVCHPESLVVEILARSPQTEISAERLRNMQQCGVNVCVDLEDLQPTSQTEKCSIPKEIISLAMMGELTAVYDVPVLTCNGQRLKGASDLNVEKLTGEWTVLWRNEMFWGKQAPNAESSFIILTHYGLIYLWRSYDNDLERCGPEEAGRFITTSGPGDFYSGFDGVPVAMKILQTDYSTMLVIWCHLDDTSQCYPDRTTIEILSRNATLDNVTRDALLGSVDTTCLDSAEWVASEPNLCRVEYDVLTSAYIDGVDVEYSKIGCRVDLMGGQAGVTDDMIVGAWRSVYQSKLSESDGAAASITFHFTKMADGAISLLYRLYSTDQKECLPARVIELRRAVNNPTAFELSYCDSASPYGYVYVLYADGEWLAVLLCEVQRDGQCDPVTLNLVLMGREGTLQLVNDTLLDTMRGLGADACVDEKSLVEPQLDPCPISRTIVTDVAKGELQACAYDSEVQCYPQYIPVHTDFDIREFSGTWYSVGESVAVGWQDDRPVGSATYHFVPRDDGTVAMLYSTVGSWQQCQPTQLRLLRPAGDGSFIFTFNNTHEPYPVPEDVDLTTGSNELQIAMLKVVWMNEDMAVTYWCFNAGRGDPWCQDQAHVSVLSRRGEKGQDLPPYLQPIIIDICVASQDFFTTDSEACEIPSDIISAVEDDSRSAVTVSFSVIQCAQPFIPTVSDFDMKLVSGVWHTVRQTQSVWGNATWDSFLRSYVVRDDGTTVMAFTGHPPGDSPCVPMEVRALQMSNQTGQWTYSEGSSTVTVKVVWTDYNSSALLYTCRGQVQEDGRCPGASLQVEFLSRSTALAPEAEMALMRRLPSVCVGEEEMEVVTAGLCQITKELGYIVGSGTDGATAPLSSCRVQDIPLEKNFTISQMTGVWYEIARTRFTFNTMESVISVYEYNSDIDLLDGLFTGTLDHKECLSPLKSVTRKKFADGEDSIIEGRIQAGESIFPWITFNILYFDGAVMMHIACYAENEDGTCPRDKTEVTLLGRTRQLTEDMEEKLDGLMKSVCLAREDLVPTKETVDCMPMLTASEEDAADLPDTAGCQLNSVPVVENLNEDDLLGTWYGLGAVDYGAASEPSGFVVSISRSTRHTLQWRQWNTRNGSCQAEKAVYMKAACAGSSNGDYISTRASSFMLQWTMVKILRLEGGLALVYQCVQETFAGGCKAEGVHVYLLGRSPAAALDDMVPLLSALPSVCLKPENMKSVLSTDTCSHLASDAVPVVETSPCAVDQLPAVQVDTEQISGIWYEMAHTVDTMFPMQKAVIVYRALPGNQMAMYLTAMDPLGQCQGPLQGRMRQRCHSNPGPEIMGRLMFPGIWSWAPWRVLAADYNTSLIILSCMDEQRDGSCSAQGLKLHFLAREPHPNPSLHQQLYDMLEQLGCFDHIQMEDVHHEGPSCKHKLDPILVPAA